MNLQTTIMGTLWAIATAGVAYYCATIAQQITYVTLADGRRQARSLPLIMKLLIPFTPNFSSIFEKKVFEKSRIKINIQIIASGFEGIITAEEIIALKIIMPICMGTLWCLFIWYAAKSAPESFLQKNQLVFSLFGPIWFSFYPTTWLKKEVAKRHKSIRRSLPFVLDLLTLSVEAGMDFMSAMQRNLEKSKIDPLTEELVRVVREIQLGKTRRESLRDMASRVNLPELRSVVNALIQADELGVSIGSILRIQSDQIRQRRFEQAEKLANEAPVKMLGPLIFFIFPAVFLVLLGPLIVQMLNQV